MMKLKTIDMDVIFWHYVARCVLCPVAFASCAVVWVYPLLLRLARKKNFVDIPNSRRLNRRPVPVMGGVVVFFGLMFSLALAGCLVEELSLSYYLIAAMAIVLMVGVADDAVGLTPRVRVVVEATVVAMLCYIADDTIDNLYGVLALTHLSASWALVLTVVGGVGVINSVNLIDGVDGLCSGYVMMVALLYGVMFSVVGDVSYAVLSFAVLGALIPFWLRNVYGGRSKMYLGDGGSLLLGLIVVAIALRFYAVGAAVLGGYVVSFTFATLSLPVLDTLRVMFSRIIKHRSPFSPDCSHLHHSFIRLGLSHKMTSISIVAMQASVVGVWYLCRRMSVGYDTAMYLTAMYAMLVTWGGYAVAELFSRKAGTTELNILTKEID